MSVNIHSRFFADTVPQRSIRFVIPVIVEIYCSKEGNEFKSYLLLSSDFIGPFGMFRHRFFESSNLAQFFRYFCTNFGIPSYANLPGKPSRPRRPRLVDLAQKHNASKVICVVRGEALQLLPNGHRSRW